MVWNVETYAFPVNCLTEAMATVLNEAEETIPRGFNFIERDGILLAFVICLSRFWVCVYIIFFYFDVTYYTKSWWIYDRTLFLCVFSRDYLALELWSDLVDLLFLINFALLLDRFIIKLRFQGSIQLFVMNIMSYCRKLILLSVMHHWWLRMATTY